ncbi:hypothetical protein LOC67_08470 [Stieleria sp. JC731]|uniref:hypothetical protein n=1 Tax=Pirellulaceae TaxID=2691357 RepID=UPI001E540DBB|nr:hypothetical protein [Stieleria sp. JC731]MCC9600593.1 hypothetical protein [Stieleria sp. JC731]
MSSLALLCVVLLFCVACNREAASEPEADPAPGVEASYDEQLRAGRAGQTSKIALLTTEISDQDLAALRDDDDWLKTLIVDRGVVSDQSIAAISQLPSLVHLRLRESPISDQGLQQLAKHPKLQILNLPQCAATAEGVQQLSQMPSLRNLRLGGDSLGADVAEAVSELEGLRSLHLIGVPVDDQGLRSIASLPRLTSLYLDDASVTGRGWDWFVENRPKVHVHVDQHHLDRGDAAAGDHQH